MFFTEIVRRK